MTRAKSNAAILWISVLGLYLELLLIRWLGTEIRIFAHLQNTILVVCFLGLGIGLFTSDRRASARPGILALVILTAALVLPATRVLTQVSAMLSTLGEINIWAPGEATSSIDTVIGLAVGLALMFGVMLLVMIPFIPIGRVLGRLMDEHPRPIVAYSVNVFGSLAGIWLFVSLSRANQPPAVWFAVLLLLCLPWLLRQRPPDWLATGLLASLVPLVFVMERSTEALETVWSPYQKFEVLRPSAESSLARLQYLVRVNSAGYQFILDRSDYGKAGAALPGDSASLLSAYDVPGLIHPSPARVLVVGAGAGNDVAGILRNTQAEVTAVDIDPTILDLGRRYHPERPYDSERVRAVIADARSFFASAEDKYDVIAFGFLESHMNTALTSARMDHYVYTRESIERARELLGPGGILTVAIFPLRPFIVDRVAVVMRDVFGHEPTTVFFPPSTSGYTGVVYMAGDLETARARIDTVPELERIKRLQADFPVELTYTTRPATDDWPYLYLDRPRIPPLFGFLAGVLALLVFLVARVMRLPQAMNPLRWEAEAWHFAFLGAAFLLLEVQNISKAAVVLGNTWLVNAVIISGVLTMILAANAVVIRWPRIPLRPVYAVLLITVLGLYFVDLASFAFLPFAWKVLVVGGLTTLPMAFSGVAFARAFAVAGRKDHALGANLIGALVGAILEAVSFLLGIRALLLAVAVLYAAAMMTRPGSRVSLRASHRELPMRARQVSHAADTRRIRAKR